VAPVQAAAEADQRQLDRRRKLADNIAGWGFAGPAVLLILGLSFIPMAWAFLLSLTDSNLISGGHYIGFANYTALVHDPLLAKAFRNTVFFTLMYLPAGLIGGLAVATLLNRNIKMIGFYRTCFLVPFIASAAAEGLLMGFIFDPDFGLVTSILHRVGIPKQGFLQDPSQALLVLAVVYFWTQFGFNVVIYMAALQDVPREVIEAAEIDGASRWNVFRHVTLPAIRPVTYFLMVWGVIETFQFFDLVYTTTKGGPLNSTYTLVFYIWQLAFNFFTAGYGAAVAYVLFFASMFFILVGLLYGRRKGMAV
jgi:multiple sugar transport system permease protein